MGKKEKKKSFKAEKHNLWSSVKKRPDKKEIFSKEKKPKLCQKKGNRPKSEHPEPERCLY